MRYWRQVGAVSVEATVAMQAEAAEDARRRDRRGDECSLPPTNERLGAC